jgi:hypothetical protein
LVAHRILLHASVPVAQGWCFSRPAAFPPIRTAAGYVAFGGERALQPQRLKSFSIYGLGR